MKLAQRVRDVGESATLAVSRRAAELVAAGIAVVDLSDGEPDFASPPEAVEAACRALRDGMTRYTVAAGLPELRAAVAEDYRCRFGAPWGAEQVVITVGGKGALFQLALALVEPGDEVVIPTPCWVSFPEQVRLAGGEPVFVETRADGDFRLRAEALMECVSSRTRVVLLNSPSNPTGQIVAENDLRAIVEVCAEKGVFVVSDETNMRFVYEDGSFPSVAPLARDHRETVVLVGSFSKTYAMTGWRIGFLLAPEKVVQAVITIQSHSISNPTTFAMVGALAALQAAEGRVREMVAECKLRRNFVVDQLSALPRVHCPLPAGALYAFPDVSSWYGEGCGGSVAFSRFLLESARVAVVPGVAFGCDDHVRVSFACSRERLETGLNRLRVLLSAPPPR
jgi:aspartate aminotransferase